MNALEVTLENWIMPEGLQFLYNYMVWVWEVQEGFGMHAQILNLVLQETIFKYQYSILGIPLSEPYFFLILVPLASIVLVTFFVFLQWLIGPFFMKRTLRLEYIKRGENSWLEKTVSELAEKSGLAMPKIAMWPTIQPNTCVFGRTARGATLAISTGLLKWLNKREVRAIIAHEMGHLKHRDYLIMTCLGSIPLMYYRIGRFILYNSKNKLRGVLPILLFGLLGLLAFVIYLLTKLAVLSLSRLREFYSDAYAAYLSMNPRVLRSALTKIAYGLSLNPEEMYAASAFFVEDPGNAKNEIHRIVERGREYDLDRDGTLDEKELQIAMEKEANKSRFNWLKNLFSTHPPTYKRILLLKQIENEIKTGRYTKENIYKYV